MEDTKLKKIMYVRIYTAKYRKGSELKLPSLGLKCIPRILDELPFIKRLDLSGNYIKEIDINILGQLNLEWLNLSGNPLPVEEVKKLEWLLPGTEIVYNMQYLKKDTPTYDSDETNNRLIDMYLREKKYKAHKSAKIEEE